MGFFYISRRLENFIRLLQWAALVSQVHLAMMVSPIGIGIRIGIPTGTQRVIPLCLVFPSILQSEADRYNSCLEHPMRL